MSCMTSPADSTESETQQQKRRQRPEQQEQREEQCGWYASGNNIGLIDRLDSWGFGAWQDSS